MAQTTLEARQQILDDLAAALDQLGLAVACLSEAFDQLDVDTADRLDVDLYHGRPSPARRSLADLADQLDGRHRDTRHLHKFVFDGGQVQRRAKIDTFAHVDALPKVDDQSGSRQ
jgi:hypothetical protein